MGLGKTEWSYVQPSMERDDATNACKQSRLPDDQKISGESSGGFKGTLPAAKIGICCACVRRALTPSPPRLLLLPPRTAVVRRAAWQRTIRMRTVAKQTLAQSVACARICADLVTCATAFTAVRRCDTGITTTTWRIKRRACT